MTDWLLYVGPIQQIFRIQDKDLVAISYQRIPDGLLLSRFKVTEKSSRRKGKYMTFQVKSHTDHLSFFQNVGDAAAHGLRLASAVTSTSQFAISSLKGSCKVLGCRLKLYIDLGMFRVFPVESLALY